MFNKTSEPSSSCSLLWGDNHLLTPETHGATHTELEAFTFYLLHFIYVSFQSIWITSQVGHFCHVSTARNNPCFIFSPSLHPLLSPFTSPYVWFQTVETSHNEILNITLKTHKTKQDTDILVLMSSGDGHVCCCPGEQTVEVTYCSFLSSHLRWPLLHLGLALGFLVLRQRMALPASSGWTTVDEQNTDKIAGISLTYS